MGTYRQVMGEKDSMTPARVGEWVGTVVHTYFLPGARVGKTVQVEAVDVDGMELVRVFHDGRHLIAQAEVPFDDFNRVVVLMESAFAAHRIECKYNLLS